MLIPVVYKDYLPVRQSGGEVILRRALSLGKIFGIRLQIHWTFILIIAWAVYVGWSQGGDTASVLWTIALVLAIFACVVLHEFGHALTARRYGIPTRKITLLPIGEVAGLLYNKRITEAFRNQNTNATVDSLMDRDFKAVQPDEGLSTL